MKTLPKLRKPKDIDVPKKPPSGYFLFATEQRKLLANPNKTVTFGNGNLDSSYLGDLNIITDEKWKALTDDEKNVLIRFHLLLNGYITEDQLLYNQNIIAHLETTLLLTLTRLLLQTSKKALHRIHFFYSVYLLRSTSKYNEVNAFIE
jgi:hypothetical protein